MMMGREKKYGGSFSKASLSDPMEKKVQVKISGPQTLAKKVKLGSSQSQHVEYFSFDVQSLLDETDPTKAFQYSIPIYNPNQKEVILCCDQIQTSILGYAGSVFPRTISVGLRNFGGFIDKYGAITNKIIVMNLHQINKTQQNGIVSRDLIYRSKINTVWNLGSLRTLIFDVYADQDNSPMILPLSNPISLAFKLLHVSY